MAIKAIKELVASWFVPLTEESQTEALQTSFQIKPLDGLQGLEIYNEYYYKDGKLILTAIGQKLALQYGLIGWKNFKDENGEPIPFSVVTVGRLPPTVLSDIAMKIVNSSTLMDEQIKN